MNLKSETVELLNRFCTDNPELEILSGRISEALELFIETYKRCGKILVCGNGGSASDCDHIVGELMKGFRRKRPIPSEIKNRIDSISGGNIFSDQLQMPLSAISLVSQVGLSTAVYNDLSNDVVFAQQVLGYGKSGDILIGLSTSGNSANVVNAAIVAKSLGLKVLSFTGESGGKLAEFSDIVLNVPSLSTYRVQEYHLPIYHFLCAAVEFENFDL